MDTSERHFDQSETKFTQSVTSSFTAICLQHRIYGKSRGYFVESRQRFLTVWGVRRGFRGSFRNWFSWVAGKAPWWRKALEVAYVPFKIVAYVTGIVDTVHLLYWQNSEPAPAPTSR